MRRYLIPALLILLVVLPGAFTATLKLDVETAVSLALENNLEIISKRIDLQTSKRAMGNAWNEFLPSLSATASLSRSNEATTVAGVEQSPWSINFTARASLTLTSASIFSIRAAILDYENGLISHEMATKKMERDVRKAFFSLILIRESIKLAETELATAVQNHAQTLKNYNSGLVPRLQVLSAQVAAENLRPALESKKLSYQTALTDFQTLLGIESENEIVLEGSIETDPQTFDGSELAAQLVNGRLDIQALYKNIELLENSKTLQALSGLSPTLSLSVSYAPGMRDPFECDWSDADAWSDSGQVTLSLSVPLSGLIPGSSTQTALAAMDDSLEKARLSLEQARREAQNEIRTIVLELDQSQRSIDALELNVALAQEAYELTEKAYQAGTKQLLEVQSASDDLKEARLSLLNEKYNYLSGLLDLEYALNISLN